MPVKKKVAKKRTIKKPTVTVETKKLSKNDCYTRGRWHRRCYVFVRVLMMLLLVANTVLLVFLLCQQNKIESMRVGWQENYKMLNEVFRSDAFKAQQKQQIQQAMQMYQIGETVPMEMELPIPTE